MGDHVYAQILNGVVVNNILADPGWNPGDGSILVAGYQPVGALYANGVFTPPSPPAPAVPQTVAMWQAQTALQSAGLLTAANAAIAALNNPAVANFWAHTQSLDRSDPILANVAATLNLTPAQVDALFIAAAAITI